MIETERRPFGELLRQLRLAAGLSRELLAERAGLSAKAIAALERGDRSMPRLSTVGLLADALQLEPSVRAELLEAACLAKATAAAPATLPAAPAPPAPGG